MNQLAIKIIESNSLYVYILDFSDLNGDEYDSSGSIFMERRLILRFLRTVTYFSQILNWKRLENLEFMLSYNNREAQKSTLINVLR